MSSARGNAMSDKENADDSRRLSTGETAIGAPRRSPGASSTTGPGKSTLIQGPGAPSPFKSVLASVAQKTEVLARAIEALDYFDAWSASLNLQRTIEDAEQQLKMLDATESAAAAGELHVLTEIADRQIARAPSPSKAAIQDASFKDRPAARPTWDAEKRA